MSKDTEYYWKLKNEGAFKEHYWVVIKNETLLSHTSNEDAALLVIDSQDGMSVLYQVGHENECAEID